MFTSPRRVRFKEQEYAVPREHLAGALTAVRDLFTRHDWRISFPVEVRVTPGDDVWLSTAYGRSTAYVAVHVFHTAPHQEYFREVEALMTALGGRPALGQAAHPRRGVPARRSVSPARSPGCGTNSTWPQVPNLYPEQVLGSRCTLMEADGGRSREPKVLTAGECSEPIRGRLRPPT